MILITFELFLFSPWSNNQLPMFLTTLGFERPRETFEVLGITPL